MHFRLAILAFAFAAAPVAGFAADAPERYSSYERDDDETTRIEQRRVYVLEEPYEERVVVRRRFVEEVSPAYYERRVHVRHGRRIDEFYDDGPRRYARPYRPGRWADEDGGW